MIKSGPVRASPTLVQAWKVSHPGVTHPACRPCRSTRCWGPGAPLHHRERARVSEVLGPVRVALLPALRSFEVRILTDSSTYVEQMPLRPTQNQNQVLLLYLVLEVLPSCRLSFLSPNAASCPHPQTPTQAQVALGARHSLFPHLPPSAGDFRPCVVVTVTLTLPGGWAQVTSLCCAQRR